MSEKLLTIGMATYDDFDGVYFTINALRLYHEICNTDAVEFVVIDNNPDGPHGKQIKKGFDNWFQKARYIPYTEKRSTTVKNEVFTNAKGKYTLCIDCHVMIQPNGINNLLKYYEENPDTKNLVQGPLMYDDHKTTSTHFEPNWRGHMYGTWANDKEALAKGEPFEIPMQGMGLFSCKTDKWVGFNRHFKGFGSEEGYIHEKIRQNGGKCICLPNLKWMHRFGRPNGVKYPLRLEDKVWNYFLGAMELYKDENHPFIKSIQEHFKNDLPEKLMQNYLALAKANI